jgi:porin
VGICCAGKATASESSAPEELNLNYSRLTGDWGGERTKLIESGITVEIDATQSYQGVVDGGVESRWKYGGSVDYEFNFDFEKMGLWPGAFIDARVEHQFGEFVNNDTGAILAANTDGLFPLPDYREVTFSKLVFTQFLSESFGIFFGKIETFDGDKNHFAGSRGRENFMHQNFVVNPVTLRTAPYSSLGAGVVFVFPDVYAEDPAILSLAALGADGQPNTAGWDEDFENGTSYSIEFSHPTNFFNQFGKQLYGAGYSNKDYTALDQNPRLILEAMLGLGTLKKDEGSWCFYYNFHQYLVTEQQDETQGWGLFGRFGIADDESSPIEDFYSIGLGGKGIIEGRDQDKWGAGYFTLGLSDELPSLVLSRYNTRFADYRSVPKKSGFSRGSWSKSQNIVLTAVL